MGSLRARNWSERKKSLSLSRIRRIIFSDTKSPAVCLSTTPYYSRTTAYLPPRGLKFMINYVLCPFFQKLDFSIIFLDKLKSPENHLLKIFENLNFPFFEFNPGMGKGRDCQSQKFVSLGLEIFVPIPTVPAIFLPRDSKSRDFVPGL